MLRVWYGVGAAHYMHANQLAKRISTLHNPMYVLTKRSHSLYTFMAFTHTSRSLADLRMIHATCPGNQQHTRCDICVVVSRITRQPRRQPIVKYTAVLPTAYLWFPQYS